MSYTRKIRDEESYRKRLEMFLTDKCLLFNPYSVSAKTLLDGIEKMRWRGLFSLTQMLFLHIDEVIIEGSGLSARESIAYRIGDSKEVIKENMSAFTVRNTAADSLKQIRSMIDGRPVTKTSQIRSLVGKTVFVSHKITTVKPRGNYGRAIAMHKLTGEIINDAAIIRNAIISSKLEMLKRLKEYPRAHIYLDGEPETHVDIATPINHLIEEIRQYTNTE